MLSDVPWSDVAPMIASLGICVLLPVVYMLLRHQRHMAEIFHRGAAAAELEERLKRTQTELDQLRDRVNTHILSADAARQCLPSRIAESLSGENKG